MFSQLFKRNSQYLFRPRKYIFLLLNAVTVRWMSHISATHAFPKSKFMCFYCREVSWSNGLARVENYFCFRGRTYLLICIGSDILKINNAHATPPLRVP
jgi:hypothetical protein